MKSLFKILLKTILLIAIAICSWFFFTPYFRVNRNREGDYFKNLPENSLDVLALGSSHIQYAFNPSVFYANSGYYSYVLGSDCQPFSMSVELLKEALKTQKPSVVIVDVFTLLSQSQVCYTDGMYYLAMQEMTGKTKAEAGKEVPDRKLGLQYTFDFLMNHSNWRTIDFSKPAEIKALAEHDPGFNYTLGYVAQMPVDYRYIPLMTFTPGQYDLSETVKDSLDQMIELCDENSIHLIFIKTPYTINQEDSDQLNAIWNYLDSRNQEHIDFVSKAEELHWFTGMDGDTWHNNAWGANIVTSYLADYVQQNKQVAAHHDNAKMDELLKGTFAATARQLMGPENINIYDLLSDAAVYPCTMMIKYTGSHSFPISDTENQLLQKAGISRDFKNQPEASYYALIQDGTIVQESDQPFSGQLSGHTIDLSDQGVLLDGAAVDANPGQLEIVFAADNFSWLNPIGIEPGVYGFWKKGCLSWECGN